MLKLGVVVSSRDAEAVWNAFRLANFSQMQGDEVKVFLVGKAVEYEESPQDEFPSKKEAENFVTAGGVILACGTCLKHRGKTGDKLCPLSSLSDLYALIKESDKIVSY